MNKFYLAIDLKSFYASVECVDLGLDPLTTNLVVADPSRTEKTICLAVSPSLKQYDIPGRARLFEVIEKVKEINEERKKHSPILALTGSSKNDKELKTNPLLSLDYHVATPRMQRYIDVSSHIYNIYLSFAAAEDIHIYSIDEVFIDMTSYLKNYDNSPEKMARSIIKEVLRQTGITATAGIGTNLYLAKIAMDIVAKHTEPDADGARLGFLDEFSFRQKLWTHTPLTDFWRIGPGTVKRLHSLGIKTIGDLALYSLTGSKNLYKVFGKNAELLIDHAWGYEPTEISDIKSYETRDHSLSSGQVLHCPYSLEDAKIVVEEMADALSLDLVSKNLVTDQMVLYLGYEKSGSSHGSKNLEKFTSSSKNIVNAVLDIFEKTKIEGLLVRRINIVANHIKIRNRNEVFQGDIFKSYKEIEQEDDKELSRMRAIIDIKKKYGKNSILKATSLEEKSTIRRRNSEIGGHRA